MEISFYLRIPGKYVNLEIANNYRQKTKRVSEGKYLVILKNYPAEIFEILNKEVNIKKWPEFLEKIKDSIETYEDLFLVIKDFIHWRIRNEHKEANTPFAYFYSKKWGKRCNSYNGIFKEILDEIGFETRFVGGLYLRPFFYNRKLRLKGRHVWVEVKLENIWIELDVTGEYILPSPLTIRLFDIKGKLKFEIDEWLKKEFKVFIE